MAECSTAINVPQTNYGSITTSLSDESVTQEDINAPTQDGRVTTQDRNQAIESFSAFLKFIKDPKRPVFVHFKVKRKKCSSCCSYYHHFLLIEVVQQEDIQIEVIVAHYTSSREIFTNNSRFGIGKFICETIVITSDENNNLFDFNSGVFSVAHSQSSDTPEVRKRFYKRLGEKIYDFGANNCEHAINHILTGISFSDETKSKQKCADLCSVVIGEFKEVGLKVALIIALVSSVAGSLTRFSYVSLMIAGVAARISNIGSNDTCANSNRLGKNIISEAIDVLDRHNKIEDFSEIPAGEQIINEIKDSFNNPLICKISEKLAWSAINKTLKFSLCTSMSVETIFVITKIVFVYVPLSKITSKQNLVRMIFVRLVAGYLSILIGVFCGSAGQAVWSPPALYFCLITFFVSIFTRYLLTLVASVIFDCFYCCFCECCCKSCYDRCYKSCRNNCCKCFKDYCCLDTDQYKTNDVESCCNVRMNSESGSKTDETTCSCTCKSCNCCSGICFFIVTFFYLASLVGIILPLVFYLD